MKFSTEFRLFAALAYVGVTVFLFDTVASLSRPASNDAGVQLAKEPVVVAKAAVPTRR